MKQKARALRGEARASGTAKCNMKQLFGGAGDYRTPLCSGAIAWRVAPIGLALPLGRLPVHACRSAPSAPGARHLARLAKLGARHRGRLGHCVDVEASAAGALAAILACGRGRRGACGPGRDESSAALLGLVVAVSAGFGGMVGHDGRLRARGIALGQGRRRQAHRVRQAGEPGRGGRARAVALGYAIAAPLR